MSCGLTISTSLTSQQKIVILHALDTSAGARSGISCLSKRLQSAINEGIAGLEFSEEEIRNIIKALELEIKENQNMPAEYYRHLSLTALRGLLGKIEELSKVFQTKGV